MEAFSSEIISFALSTWQQLFNFVRLSENEISEMISKNTNDDLKSK